MQKLKKNGKKQTTSNANNNNKSDQEVLANSKCNLTLVMVWLNVQLK